MKMIQIKQIKRIKIENGKFKFKRLFSFIMAIVIIAAITPSAVSASKPSEPQEPPPGAQTTDMFSSWAEFYAFMAHNVYELGNESTYSNFQGNLTAGKFDTMLVSFGFEYDYDDINRLITRGEVISVFYEIITGDTGAFDAIDYFVRENLIRGRVSGDYQLGAICTVEEMIVFALRTHEHLQHLAGEYTTGFFWRVSGGESTAYLLGSVHFSDGSLYPMSRAIEEAFAGCENIVFEIDMIEMSEEDIIYINNLGILTDGTTIADYISPEVYAAYAEICGAVGLTPDIYNYMRPWLAWMTLQQYIFLGESLESPMNAILGIDNYYLAKASVGGKNIMELESARFQMEMYDSFSPGLQEVLLIGVLMSFIQDEETSDINAEEAYLTFIAGLEAIKQGDDEYMIAFIGRNVEYTHPLDIEFFTKMYIERDNAMAEKIDILLQDGGSGDYFIIVGAAHLLGEGSIIDLLEQMGYTVERIR
jgi:uncharacterized protein YbaP (TraB family)